MLPSDSATQAIHVLEQLWSVGPDAGLVASEIARGEGAALSEILVVLDRLAQAGFVEIDSRGEYRLSRSPNRIRLADVRGAVLEGVGFAGRVPRALMLSHVLDLGALPFERDGAAEAA